MFPSWERQAAESLTNAQHMQEVRQRIDLEHQERLRRREQERAEAEMKRQMYNLRRLPAPPLLNKHRARTYDRPWAKNAAGTKKAVCNMQPSSTSDHVHGPRAGHLSNRSCVSKLPVIACSAQMQKLTVSGKTQGRATATMTSLRKELPPPCHRHKSVNEKNAASKMAPSKDFYAPRRMQSRRTREAPSQEIPTEKPKTAPSLNSQVLSPIRDLDSSSVPLPLSSPDWTPVDWGLVSSFHCPSPCPADESDLQLIPHPFQECLSEGSVGEDIGVSDSSGSRDLCGADLSGSSADSGISRSHYPSDSGGTSESSLSDHFRSLDLLPSQNEGEDDPVPARVNPSCGTDPSPPSCNARTPVFLEPPVRPENSFLRQTNRVSFRGGDSPVTPIAELISAAPGSGQESMPAERSPTTGTGRQSLDGDRLEEQEEGGEVLISIDSASVTSQRPRTSELLDYLALALMARQDRTREGNRGSAPDTKPPADPETLRRITESLLEEESDEEEGNLCRICQGWGSTPQNPLLTPCQCTGSLQYVHHDCLKRWIQTKVQSGAEITAVKACELCKTSLNLDLEGFDLEECYRQRQTQVEQAGRVLHVLRLLLQDMVYAVETHNYTSFNVTTALCLIHQMATNTSVRLMVASPQSESARTGHQHMAPSEETPNP